MKIFAVDFSCKRNSFKRKFDGTLATDGNWKIKCETHKQCTKWFQNKYSVLAASTNSWMSCIPIWIFFQAILFESIFKAVKETKLFQKTQTFSSPNYTEAAD